MSFLNRFRKRQDPGAAVQEDETDVSRGVTAVAEPPATPPPGVPVGGGTAAGRGPDMDAIRSDLARIEELMIADDPEPAGAETGSMSTLRLKLGDVLGVLPDGLRGSDATPEDGARTVRVIIEDLYGQLGKGRVMVSLAGLAQDVPESLLSADYPDRLDEEIALPLPLVVSSISPEELTRRTASRDRAPDLHELPDLFKRDDMAAEPVPSVAAPSEPAFAEPVAEPEPPEPAVEAVAPEPVLPEPVAELVPPQPTPPEPVADITVPEVEPAQPVADIAPPRPRPAPPAAPVSRPAAQDVGSGPGALVAVLARGVDLNAVDAAQLRRALPGVGRHLAEQILRHRPFRSIFDLARVPGIGRRLFERITGEHMPSATVQVETIEALLGPAETGLLPLRDVARNIATLPGVVDCILSQSDGYVLASTFGGNGEHPLGAFVPQMFKRITRYTEALDMGEMPSMTIFLTSRPVSLICSGEIYVSLFHGRGRYSRRRTELMEAVAAELSRRLAE